MAGDMPLVCPWQQPRAFRSANHWQIHKAYYQYLVRHGGLLQLDHEFLNGNSQYALVRQYNNTLSKLSTKHSE
jgi:hypothetical protein